MAQEHPQLLHVAGSNDVFFIDDIGEIITNLRSKIKDKAMIVEDYEAFGSDNGSDFKSKGKIGAFMIIKKVPAKTTTRSHITQALSWAEDIGWQVIARMDRDAEDPNHILYRFFSLNNVEFQKVGPIYDNFYGYRFTFTWTDPEEVRYDPDKWIA